MGYTERKHLVGPWVVVVAVVAVVVVVVVVVVVSDCALKLLMTRVQLHCANKSKSQPWGT